MNYIGDFLDDAVVPLGGFTTNAADGGRESMSASLEEGDIKIYSDDGDGTWTLMTLDASTIVITENPGSMVGCYLVGVDMNNDSDFVAGKDYVAFFYPDETVDSQSIAACLGHWSCENRTDSTDLALSDHNTSGTFGEALNKAAVFDLSVISGDVDDVSASASGFDGNSELSSSDDFYNGMYLFFTSGNNEGVSRMISDYTGTGRTFAFSGSAGENDAAFPANPSNNDTFVIIGRGE